MPPCSTASMAWIWASLNFPSLIAEQHGITTEELLKANNMTADSVIYPGDTLLIPLTGTPQAVTLGGSNLPAGSSDYFKILPDSELVYGPLSALLPPLPRETAELELRCNEWVPKGTIPGSQDERQLGIQVSRIVVKADGTNARVFNANQGRYSRPD